MCVVAYFIVPLGMLPREICLAFRDRASGGEKRLLLCPTDELLTLLDLLRRLAKSTLARKGGVEGGGGGGVGGGNIGGSSRGPLLQDVALSVLVPSAEGLDADSTTRRLKRAGRGFTC